MKSFIGAALVALALCGCSITPNPINRSIVYEGVAGYAIGQKLALIYVHLPTCAVGTHTSATNYCADPGVVVAIASANAKVRIARTALEAFVQNPANYPGLNLAQLTQAFQTAVTTLSDIEASNGVTVQ